MSLRFAPMKPQFAPMKRQLDATKFQFAPTKTQFDWVKWWGGSVFLLLSLIFLLNSWVLF